MEKIEALVNVLGRFGVELNNVKTLIGDIEEEVNKHVLNLKEELARFKKGLKNGEVSKPTLLDEEKAVYERLLKLRKELESLENAKDTKQIPKQLVTTSTPLFKGSMSNISMRTTMTSMEDISNVQDFSPNKKALVAPYVYLKNDPRNILDEPLPKEWWRVDDDDEKDREMINWQKEYAEREEMKLNLMIREGWRKHNSSQEELVELLRVWTGRLSKWNVVMWGRAKNGKLMCNVKFNSVDDRRKVFDLRKEIAEEGNLFIGEALSFVERKERYKMLMMAERLKADGRSVEFENRRICVDGEWWKYRWETGWKKVQTNAFYGN